MKDRFVITDLKQVLLVGKNKYKAPVISFPDKKSCTNELIFHLSGESTVYFNGKQLQVSANSIRFLPKGEVWEYVVERRECGDCIDIFFDTDIPVAEEAFVLKPVQSQQLKHLFQKLFALWVAKNTGYYFACVSILYQIFAELQKKNTISESQFLAVKPAIEYIENNFLTKKISVEDLAACCTISYPYIKKLFLKKFGMSPIRYSIQLKINYACDLLKLQEYTIGQIAQLCNYKDEYFFSRQFKEYVGVSPSAFAEQYRSSLS